MIAFLNSFDLFKLKVGRALGPSILDLTESNPSSRLRMSEFRNLQGLRNALRNDIERGLLRADPIQKVSNFFLFCRNQMLQLNYTLIGKLIISFLKHKKKSNIQHKPTNELSNKKRIKRRIIVIRKKNQLPPIHAHGPFNPLDSSDK